MRAEAFEKFFDSVINEKSHTEDTETDFEAGHTNKNRSGSGHADRDELLKWLGNLKTPPKKTFVVHGESEAALSFASLVTQSRGWNAVAPTYGQEFVLE